MNDIEICLKEHMKTHSIHNNFHVQCLDCGINYYTESLSSGAANTSHEMLSRCPTMVSYVANQKCG